MKVLLAFKNPSRPLNDTFEIECPLETSIGGLKETLQGVYPGNPAPEAITLIYAGKVLKDHGMPLSAFISTDTPSPVAIHIVVKGAAPSSSSSTVQAERPNSAASSSTRASSREEVVEQGLAPSSVISAVVEPEAATGTVPLVPQPINSNASAVASTAIPIPAPVEPQVNVPQSSVQPAEPAVASTSKQPEAEGPQPTPPPPAFASAPQEQTAPSFPPGMETFYSNQMAYGVAYQAAYQAALQSMIAVQQQQQYHHHQQQQQNNGALPSGSTANDTTNQPLPGAGQVFYPMPFAPPPHPYCYNYNYNYQMMPPPPQQQYQGGMGDVRQRRQAAVVAAVAGGPDGRVPEDLLRRLRELRNRGFQLPPALVAALDRYEEAQGGAANGAVRPRVHRFQFRIQINIRALLQLAVMLVVVYQHCPPKRFAVLCLLGFALWLSTIPRVRAFLQTIAGLGPNNNNRRGGVAVPVPAPQPFAGDGQPAPAPVAAEAAPGEGAAERGPAHVANADAGGAAAAALDNNNPALDPQQHPEQPRPAGGVGGVLHEIHAFIAGFITSLLPAMDHHNNNNNDEANAAGGGGAMREVFGGEQ